MTKILHIINNDNDGIGHFVKNLISNDLKNYDNQVFTKYKSSSNFLCIDSGLSTKKLLKSPKLICNHFIELLFKVYFSSKRLILNYYYEPKSLFTYYLNSINIKKLKKYVKKIDVLIVYSFRETISLENLIEIKKEYNPKIFFYPCDDELLSGGYHFKNLEKLNLK